MDMSGVCTVTKRKREICLFCLKLRMPTREDIFPFWLSNLIKDQVGVGENWQHHTVRSNNETTTKRVGGSTVFKLTPVCAGCNGGWMRKLEDLARPILTPLVVGTDTHLSVDDQHVIARWIALNDPRSVGTLRHPFDLRFSSGPYRTRTCDPLRVMQVRYQLR